MAEKEIYHLSIGIDVQDKNAKSKLTSFKQYASENIKQIKLKSMRKKPNEQTQHIILYLDEFKFNTKPAIRHSYSLL